MNILPKYSMRWARPSFPCSAGTLLLVQIQKPFQAVVVSKYLCVHVHHTEQEDRADAAFWGWFGSTERFGGMERFGSVERFGIVERFGEQQLLPILGLVWEHAKVWGAAASPL